MKIGIDIDGVLFPWSLAANAAVMDRFGVPDPGDHTHWDHLMERLTPDQWGWLWSAEGQAVVFGQLDVYPGVVEAFTAFLKDPEHKCHFVTHRDPRRTGVATSTYLAHHFGGHPWAGTHVLQNGCRKHELTAWDVFIDDKPSTVYDMLDHTNAQVFAPARPWNEELDGLGTDRLIRYSNPLEVSRWVALR